jgi:hypothetical protein
MEECWFADKHKKLGEEPLECLECKRMKGKVLQDKPDDPELALFFDGFRLAMLQVGAYINQKDHPISEYHKKLLIGIDLRMKCAIDRGISLKQLQHALDKLTTPLFKEMLKGKSFDEP